MCLCGGVGPLFAQNAELSDLITDPAGLSVPNANVTVQSEATGVTRAVTSNQGGLYSVPALPPDTYKLEVDFGTLGDGYDHLRAHRPACKCRHRAEHVRPPDQLHDLSAVRPGDPDAWLLARQRRPEWRPQSALSDRRPALGSARSEARFLRRSRLTL
ncbi:MAG: carboxypeptidase regulatory-like domain-containing protein [Acidobacteriia bacterium]|nr:carboxypeptidase regulatory-like domain-containing protein [Terriglobia bacterium]